MNRRHRLAAFALALLVAVPVGGSQVSTPAGAGRIVEHRLASAALKQNLVGDPAETDVAVYLPPGYETSGRRYPTVYLLHGYLGTHRSFMRGYRGLHLETTMDELIARGVTREMIVVLPNTLNAYFGSFYTNSTATGRWEDFVVQDLVTWVDKQFRTLAAAESRGIAGHSMGGYGAIMLGMKHPDTFSAVYALSPCCVGFEGDLTSDNQAWHKTLQMTSRDQLTPKPRSVGEFFSTVFVAISASMSPNPQSPPFFADFPYTEQNNRLVRNEAAYAQWRAKMPLYLVEQYRANLEKLRGIYLDYGALEEFSHIRTATQAFARELADRGIAHTFEVYADGDHSSRIRERLETRVMRFFADVLRTPTATVRR